MKANQAVLFLAVVALSTAVWYKPNRRGRRCSKGFPNSAPVNCTTYKYAFHKGRSVCLRTCQRIYTFRTQRECDTTCRSALVCREPRVVASCAGRVFDVFYFDPWTETCRPDKTCISVGNNFPTKQECELTCIKRLPQEEPCGIGELCPDHSSNAVLVA